MTWEALGALMAASSHFAGVRRRLAGGPIDGALVALLRGLAVGAAIVTIFVLAAR